MLAPIKRFFGPPPTFRDEEKTRSVRLLYVFLLIIILATALTALISLMFQGVPKNLAEAFTPLSAITMGAMSIGLLFLARRGHVSAVGVVLSTLIWSVLTFWIFTTAGISSDGSLLGYATATVLAGVLLGGRGAIAFALLSITAVLVAFYAELNNLLIVVDKPLTILDPALALINLILVGLFLRHAVSSMNNALERARENERAQVEANRKLEEIRRTLEQRVADRTRDLERRSSYLEASAEVGRASSTILEVDELIRQSVELIRQRFGLYYVGLFQVDERREWAVLQAGTGEAGKAMLSRGHRIRIGEGMIGWSIANAQPRIASQAEADAVRLHTPELPETRSEAALPLRSRGQVIGALTIQSDQPDIFDEDTLTALQTVADQVAVALDNAHLFTEAQEALEAERRAYGEISRKAWEQLIRTRPDLGYLCDASDVTRPALDQWQPEMVQASREGRTVQNESTVAIPIKIRDQVLGIARLRKPDDAGKWMAEEIELMENLTAQLSLALESARLYEDTQRRAAREQVTAEIGARLRESLDMETVLKTAVDQLYDALALEKLSIHLSAERIKRTEQSSTVFKSGHDNGNPTVPPADEEKTS